MTSLIRVALVASCFLVLSSCSLTDDEDIRVYVTKNGKKYHTGVCEHLGKSKIPMKLNLAIAEGYTPCQKCNAKQLTTKK